MTLEQKNRLDELAELVLAEEATQEQVNEYKELLDLWNHSFQINELP
ncbi:hypothetical protein J7384_05595 [Endozoicomonas sp. G2_1]|nr:hypothetical protein [Endozoicomonas sp. G2_1]MBO9489829.1 hypothetical protein [Endozoicomonas sp. G2_1]